MKKSVIITLFLILAIAAFVSAAGSSTGGDGGGGSSVGNSNMQQSQVAHQAQVSQMRDCNIIATTQGRIKCRLESRQNERPAGSEESCRTLAGTDRAECENLYRVSTSCYGMLGRGKAACFKEKVNFGRSLKEASGKAKKQYIVLLLYDLQERVENAYKVGTITTDDSARLINTIVEAKQSILAGEPKQIVRTKIQALKATYSEVMKA